MTLSSALAGAGEEDKALVVYDRGLRHFQNPPLSVSVRQKHFLRWKSQKKRRFFSIKFSKPIPKKWMFSKLSHIVTVTWENLPKLTASRRKFSLKIKIMPAHGLLPQIIRGFHASSTKLSRIISLPLKNIETKAYAEHFISVIKQQLDETQLEKEYEESLKKK